MEAAPRLPMLAFDLKECLEPVQFGPKLKNYIARFYNEDPDSYNNEIFNLESLRAQATRPTADVSGVELLKKYYCQLHFLRSRFPMEEGEPCHMLFLWNITSSSGLERGADVKVEQLVIMYNIGALHTHLGAQDSRNTPEGMKMACTHFQCAAWAFQNIKENYHQILYHITTMELIQFYNQMCLAQAQECILEKSMLDNRKPSIIAKVAIQVFDYYRQSMHMLQSAEDQCSKQKYKEWMRHLQFKLAYHRCVSLLFQGQQAEEQQKMGERVAFYQAACSNLEEARKLASSIKTNQKELMEAITFTTDVVEGKRKAAKNENEFIYHEEVPDLSALQEVKGASLVKGIPFSVNDVEVSGPDIFARLVPMEAHEASSLYSEKKAEILRRMGERIENKDQELAELVSSMPLDFLVRMKQATGIPQELVDRAAALTARPTVTQDLVDSMGKLSGIYQEVEGELREIDALLKEEEESEKLYQEQMGKRPPSIIATDLSREASKYKEAHTKANDSNQTLHKAMTTHVANLKILQQPLRSLQQQLPAVELPNSNIDDTAIKELELINSKVEEMRTQRAMLWAQLREAVHGDDITGALVTKTANQSLDELFQKELEKHQQLIGLIEQNLIAQENIKKAFVDVYARSLNTRRYIQDIIAKRNSTIQALISSHDTYEDLLAKANKGIEFYTKLETNVSKLLQRIKSASKVQQEEREQMLTKNELKKEETVNSPISSAPKLKDYLEARKKASAVSYDPSLQYPVNYPSQNNPEVHNWPTSARPAPIGSSNEPSANESNYNYPQYSYAPNVSQYQQHNYQSQVDDLSHRMNSLLSKPAPSYSPSYTYSNYIPQNYASVAYSSQAYGNTTQSQPTPSQMYDPTKAFTSTTNSYQPISSHLANSASNSTMQYPASSLNTPDQNYQHSNYGAYTQNTETATTGYPHQTGNYPMSNPYPQQGAYVNYPTSSGSATDLTYAHATTGTTVGEGYAQQNVGAGGYQQVVTPPQGAYMQGATQDIPNGYPQQQQQSAYSDTTYFPPGYAPNYASSPTSASSQTNILTSNDYHSHEYATSVRPDLSTINTYGVYSSPTTNRSMPAGVPDSGTSTGYSSYSSLYSNQGQTYGTQEQNYGYGSYNQSYYGSTTPQIYSSTDASIPTTSVVQTYQNHPQTSQPYTQTQLQQQPQPVQQQSIATTKESNVDLLSGLDFTISQPPLVPEQNLTAKSQEEIQEVKPNPSKLKVTGTKPKEELKQDKQASLIKILPSKKLGNQDEKNLFHMELDKYEKYVESLTSKTLSGPTNLDVKWKEIQDKQDSDTQKRIISVARCYPMKNRFPDILPYDACRVELEGTKDDYINASFIKDISPFAPLFIITQAPLQSTFGDFWTMVREQQVELIFCLANDKELGDDIYWPKEKGQIINIANMVISLQSVIVKTNWTERLISVAVPEKKKSRIVMHLQFTSWPGSLFPLSPEPFVSYITEMIGLFQQQRNISHPIVVHCSTGIGRSGLTCLLTTAILDVANNANTIPDLALITSKLCNCQKNILRDREHLKFGYEAFLWYMRSVVEQDNAKKKLSDIIIPKKEEIVEAVVTEPQPQHPADPLNALDALWATKR